MRGVYRNEQKKSVCNAQILPLPVAKIFNYLLWFELFTFHVIFNHLVNESALRDVSKPMGVTTCRLTQILPPGLQESWSTIEELEKELGYGG
jgi:hypothetical protein